MSIFWETEQKARVEHFCDRCCHNIYPKDIYRRKVLALEPGKLFVLKEHVNPECPEDEFAEMYQPTEAVPFGYKIVMEAVQKVRLNGDVETVFEPKCVMVGETAPEPEPPEPSGDYDPDIPF